MSMVRGKLEPTIEIVPSKVVIGETNVRQEGDKWVIPGNPNAKIESFSIEDLEKQEEDSIQNVALAELRT